MLVVVPVRSWAMATGSTTSARAAEGERKPSTATTKPAEPRASSARARSGKSPTGSDPTSTMAPIDPSTSAPSMAAASRPRPAGTEPQAASYQARPSSRLTRPGSRPGARPMSRAPITFPRRNAARNARLGPRLGHGGGSLGHQGPVLCQRRPAEHHDDTLTAVPGALQGAPGRHPGVGVHRVGVVLTRPDEGASQGGGLSGAVRQHGRGELAQGAGARGELDDRDIAVDRSTPQAQKQDGKFLSQVTRQHHHARAPRTPRRSWPAEARAPPRRAGRPRAGRRPSRCR